MTLGSGKPKKTARIQIKLRPWIQQELQDLARREERSLEGEVIYGIKRYLGMIKQENYENQIVL